MRKALSWRLVLGGGWAGIGWHETLDLTPCEAEVLLEGAIEMRKRDMKLVAALVDKTVD